MTSMLKSSARMLNSPSVPRPSSPTFDPHKPFVDTYRWPCKRCSDISPAPDMVRVSEVIDAWFDSGSSPFAQWQYPVEATEMVAEQYPADFIAEGLDQTRGWFYSLLAIATGLGDALPNNGGTGQGSAGGGKVAPYSAVVVNDSCSMQRA